MIAPVKATVTDNQLDDNMTDQPCHVIIIPNELYVTPYIDDAVSKFQRVFAIYGGEATTFPLNDPKEVLYSEAFQHLEWLNWHDDLNNILPCDAVDGDLEYPWI